MSKMIRLLHTTRRLLKEEPPNQALEYLAQKAARKQASTTKPPNRHLLFYRDILPPFLRVLAWGSSAYFTLHLTWNLLDRDEQRALMQKQTALMEEKIKSVVAGVMTETKEEGKGWFDWIKANKA